LVREAGDVIELDRASEILGLARPATSKKLSRWAEQGWLRRIRSGVYVASSLDMLTSEAVISDPWILVPALYEPAYIGGRTAAEHWDLTEQIFNDVVVMTTGYLRSKSQEHHGIEFSLKHISEKKFFGLKTLWREHTKVLISDPHKTIIDMLDDPLVGGGIQHVDDCLMAYLNRPDRDFAKLIGYAEQQANGAIFKRLGFLLERLGIESQLQKACAKRLTKGTSHLDPATSKGKVVSRWRLSVPVHWLEGSAL
jgi:predicted transcriptional regulator of viral defense system